MLLTVVTMLCITAAELTIGGLYIYLVPTPNSLPMATTNLCSVSMSSFSQSHTQLRLHSICLLCLTDLTSHNALEVHPCCYKWQDFPLFFMAVYNYIGCVCHIFFIHSSINGQLGCFPVLAILNNAAMNIRMQIALQDHGFIFFRYIPRVKLPYHMLVLFLSLSPLFF